MDGRVTRMLGRALRNRTWVSRIKVDIRVAHVELQGVGGIEDGFPTCVRRVLSSTVPQYPYNERERLMRELASVVAKTPAIKKQGRRGIKLHIFYTEIIRL